MIHESTVPNYIKRELYVRLFIVGACFFCLGNLAQVKIISFACVGLWLIKTGTNSSVSGR